MWPYSPQYIAVTSEGHRLPPPSFGAPTLSWHFGIWPGQKFDSNEDSVGEKVSRRQTQYDERRKNDIDAFDERTFAFFTEVSEVLRTLQERGRIVDAPMQELTLKSPLPQNSYQSSDGSSERTHSFKVCEPQSLSFTLWWQDGAGEKQLNTRPNKPAPGDLRVRVQAQTHLDHATISFFIDVGKPWNCDAIYSSKIAEGIRRSTIFKRVEQIRSICDRQIYEGHVDFDRLHERGVADEEAKLLLDSAEYFYVEIWEEFLKSFGLESIETGSTFRDQSVGEVFANFRSLILSVDGISTPVSKERDNRARELRRVQQIVTTPPSEPGSENAIGIGRFATFDNEYGEPNTVLKAYWPFTRRMTPNAAERDFVACGILDWRVLYVTALGSAAVGGAGEETVSDTPHVPQGWLAQPISDADHDRERPIRYLFLTKGEPHRQQIGRFVERVNAVETMRHFALKNWSTVRNASTYIRILGQELDGILSDWSSSRREIDREWEKQLLALGQSGRQTRRNRRRILWRRVLQSKRLPIESPSVQDVNDERLEVLSALISETESKLISLGAALDGIGQGGSGRLLYVINRSRHFIDEFERMADTLEIGNIDTWINYAQFVDRGLKPTFDLIKGTGERLLSLRGRLQTITEMIQTGALIVEAEATRSNTATLRKIASNWWWMTIGVWALVTATGLTAVHALLPDLLQPWIADLKEWLGIPTIK
jgi:hypothetical protein